MPFYIRVTDRENHESFSEVSRLIDLKDAVLLWYELMFEKCEVPQDSIIKTKVDENDCMEFSVTDVGPYIPEKELITGYIQPICFKEFSTREERLKEIIRMSNLLPPDQLKLALSEGYDLEEIAIAAIEEVE